jgi:hypothetical protein
MARIQHPEWRDQNEFSKYPFGDAATLVSTDGLGIGADTFIDATLYPIGAEANLYITSIVVEARNITINIGNNSQLELAKASFDPFDTPDLLQVTDAFGRAAGILVSTALRLSRFQGWSVGTHTFAEGASEFAASVVIPTPETGVRGFITPGGGLVAGETWIVGDNGVVVREEDGNIRIDIVGDPLFRRKICAPAELFNTPVFIKTINGCEPDEYGNFSIPVGGKITEDVVLRVVPCPEGLLIEAVGRLNSGG